MLEAAAMFALVGATVCIWAAVATTVHAIWHGDAAQPRAHDTRRCAQAADASSSATEEQALIVPFEATATVART